MRLTGFAATPQESRWRAALTLYRQPKVLRMALLGFSAGLPLLLVFGTLSFWLREAGIDRTTIGWVSGVALLYGLKWVWAPLVDRMPLPGLTRGLGRRRAWLLLAQVGLTASLAAMAFIDPAQQLSLLVGLALATAFFSATQDIALDAYRIESAPPQEQGALAAAYQTGYRLAMIWAGAGALWIAARFDGNEATYEHAPWTAAYLAMAASMAVGLITTLWAPEPQGAALLTTAQAPGWRERLREAVLDPFADFFRRYHRQALTIVLLIATYRIADEVMGVMAYAFYKDMGFTKDEVAMVSKVYGLAMTLTGAFVGGALVLRWGVLRVLFVGALLSAATNLLYAWMATLGGAAHQVPLLMLVVSADNLASGIASSAFVAYLSGLTSVAYSATQYALFSSLMQLLPKTVGTLSGWAVDAFGYSAFFLATAALGVPVLMLIALTAYQSGKPPTWRADSAAPTPGDRSTTRPDA